jgi:Raf kinase inhibitor-like YbhB/YbcL family protein
LVLELKSAAFASGDPIPPRFTGDDGNFSPPLAWSDPPPGTRSLALVCIDPDAPHGPFTHWVVFNLPADSRDLPEGIPPEPTLDDGTNQGANDLGEIGYAGPAPPRGKLHHYVFKLFALDTPLNLPPGASHAQLRAATPGHVLAEAELIGTFETLAHHR